MKLLLDTHLVLWAAGAPKRLSPAARTFLKDPANELLVSVASFWEIVIKRGLGGILLLTSDSRVSQYPGPIKRV